MRTYQANESGLVFLSALQRFWPEEFQDCGLDYNNLRFTMPAKGGLQIETPSGLALITFAEFYVFRLHEYFDRSRIARAFSQLRL